MRSLVFLMVVFHCIVAHGQQKEKPAKPVVSPTASPIHYQQGHWGFEVQIPHDWIVRHQRDLPDSFMVGIGLPLTWSELEQQSIENAIVISVYRDEGLNSVGDVVEMEKKRTADWVTETSSLDSKEGLAFDAHSRINGLEYVSRVFCRFDKNGLGYVISFTATPGTFEANLPKLKSFMSELNFQKVTEAPDEIKNRTNYEIAKEYYKLGPDKADKIIKYLQKQLDESPDHLKALFLLASTQKGLHKLDEAVETIVRAEKILANTKTIVPKFVILKAECYYYQKKYDQAKRILNPMWALVENDAPQKAQYKSLMKMIEAKLAEANDN